MNQTNEKNMKKLINEMKKLERNTEIYQMKGKDMHQAQVKFKR